MACFLPGPYSHSRWVLLCPSQTPARKAPLVHWSNLHSLKAGDHHIGKDLVVENVRSLALPCFLVLFFYQNFQELVPIDSEECHIPLKGLLAFPL